MSRNNTKTLRNRLASWLGIAPDALRCESCEAEHPEIHHVIPRSDNGDDSPRNLVALCHACHVVAHRTLADRKNMFWLLMSVNPERGRWPREAWIAHCNYRAGLAFGLAHPTAPEMRCADGDGN